jgi:hypothetical protein
MFGPMFTGRESGGRLLGGGVVVVTGTEVVVVVGLVVAAVSVVSVVSVVVGAGRVEVGAGRVVVGAGRVVVEGGGRVVVVATKALLGGAVVGVGRATVVEEVGTVVVVEGSVVVVGGNVVAATVTVVGGTTTLIIFGFELSAAWSREFSAARTWSCRVRAEMVAVSLLSPTVGGRVVGTCPSWDWMTRAAALMSCLALTGFLAESARLACPSCFSASTSWAGTRTPARLGCSRAPMSAPPAIAPTRSIVAAATSNLARL